MLPIIVLKYPKYVKDGPSALDRKVILRYYIPCISGSMLFTHSYVYINIVYYPSPSGMRADRI